MDSHEITQVAVDYAAVAGYCALFVVGVFALYALWRIAKTITKNGAWWRIVCAAWWVTFLVSLPLSIIECRAEVGRRKARSASAPRPSRPEQKDAMEQLLEYEMLRHASGSGMPRILPKGMDPMEAILGGGE